MSYETGMNATRFQRPFRPKTSNGSRPGRCRLQSVLPFFVGESGPSFCSHRVIVLIYGVTRADLNQAAAILSR